VDGQTFTTTEIQSQTNNNYECTARLDPPSCLISHKDITSIASEKQSNFGYNSPSAII